MTREDELDIIRRVLDGDVNAFEQIVLTHQKNIYNLALKMVGNPDDAFDITQDAFLRAYNSLASFHGDSKLSVWLYRLTSNICIDFLRKKKRRNEVSLTVQDDDEEDQLLQIPDERFSPESEVERTEQREAIRAGLMQLPENDRQILVLRELNGLSYEEIAETLELELGTVKSKLFRARKKLCSFLLKDGNFSPDSPSKGRKEV